MGEATAIILAAGKGTRMRSPLPKVLHTVCGFTLLECVVNAVREAGISQIIVVVGDKGDAVRESLRGMPVTIAEQREQLGTAHAVMCARHILAGGMDTVIVLNGDTPLIKPQTVRDLIATNARSDADATMLTAHLDRPKGYGRISRDLQGRIKGIVEESEASAEEAKINEINVGMYGFKGASFLAGLDAIVPHNKKGEFYLTDIISIFYRSGKRVEGIAVTDTAEVLGINTQRELAEVNQVRRNEILRSLMDRGVIIVDTTSAFIENCVEIGEGTKIYPFTYIGKNVVIGRRCRIGPFAHVQSGARIGDDAEVRNMIEFEKAGLFSQEYR
ncbi:MAG: NTP transferase domain-containing protein [Planctomycetota bacterium]